MFKNQVFEFEWVLNRSVQKVGFLRLWTFPLKVTFKISVFQILDDFLSRTV